ncbi:MAG: hypothetical protein JXR83_18430 [Deltaproteobacteria bacterium]|nr:hypothetical protein [Deltaproteobacteria bacterium]
MTFEETLRALVRDAVREALADLGFPMKDSPSAATSPTSTGQTRCLTHRHAATWTQSWPALNPTSIGTIAIMCRDEPVVPSTAGACLPIVNADADDLPPNLVACVSRFGKPIAGEA